MNIFHKFVMIFYQIRYKIIFKLSLYLLGVIFLGSIGIYLTEYRINEDFKSPFDIFYFIITTMSTVGFGDKFAVSLSGKIVVTLVIICSVILIAATSALTATIFIESHLKRELGMEKIKLKNHIVIIGWNLKGPDIVKTIIENPNKKVFEIVIVANLERKPISSPLIHFVKSNYPISRTELTQASSQYAEDIIILANYNQKENSDALTSAQCVMARSVNKDCIIHSELLNPRNSDLLKHSGANQIIGSGELGGRLLAGSCLKDPDIINIIETLSKKGLIESEKT